MFTKVLIAHDGSQGAARALGGAIRVAKRFEADLQMICVEELPRFPASLDEVVEDKEDQNHRFQHLITTATAQAGAEGLKLTANVVIGHAVPTIVEFVERHKFDLLVVGYMGHSALYNRIIGSTTDRLVELAPCAVLVVK